MDHCSYQGLATQSVFVDHCSYQWLVALCGRIVLIGDMSAALLAVISW